MKGDWKGIRWELRGNKLHVPLYDYVSREKVYHNDITAPIVAAATIQNLVLTASPDLRVLETRMGLAHREAIANSVGDGRLLEFGAGVSTLWFRDRIDVLTVEHDPVWATIIGGCLLYPMPNAPTRCEEAEKVSHPDHGYVQPRIADKFDVILVDGILRNECLKYAPKFLKPGGVVWLHDAQRNWYDRAKQEYTMITEIGECEDYRIPTLWAGVPRAANR